MELKDNINKKLLLHVVNLYLNSYDRKLFDDDKLIMYDFFDEVESGNYSNYSFDEYKTEFKVYVMLLRKGRVKYD